MRVSIREIIKANNKWKRRVPLWYKIYKKKLKKFNIFDCHLKIKTFKIKQTTNWTETSLTFLTDLHGSHSKLAGTVRRAISSWYRSLKKASGTIAICYKIKCWPSPDDYSRRECNSFGEDITVISHTNLWCFLFYQKMCTLFQKIQFCVCFLKMFRPPKRDDMFYSK